MNWYRPLASTLFASLLFGASQLNAGVQLYSSETAFNSLGTIDQNSNFDSFTYGYSFAGANYGAGDFTFDNPANLILAPEPLFLTLRSVITEYDYSALSAGISGVHTMLAFDANRIATHDMLADYYYSVLDPNVSGTVYTNKGAYSVTLGNVLMAFDGLSFFGFATDDPSEYFTGFSFRTSEYFGSSIGMTDLRLGSRVENVDDTASSLGLLGLCLGALALIRRRGLKRG